MKRVISQSSPSFYALTTSNLVIWVHFVYIEGYLCSNGLDFNDDLTLILCAGDLYLVFEYMDTDLSNIIKSNQYVQTEHIQFILYQILCGLKFIHSCNVIHR